MHIPTHYIRAISESAQRAENAQQRIVTIKFKHGDTIIYLELPYGIY